MAYLAIGLIREGTPLMVRIPMQSIGATVLHRLSIEADGELGTVCGRAQEGQGPIIRWTFPELTGCLCWHHTLVHLRTKLKSWRTTTKHCMSFHAQIILCAVEWMLDRVQVIVISAANDEVGLGNTFQFDNFTGFSVAGYTPGEITDLLGIIKPSSIGTFAWPSSSLDTSKVRGTAHGIVN